MVADAGVSEGELVLSERNSSFDFGPRSVGGLGNL